MGEYTKLVPADPTWSIRLGKMELKTVPVTSAITGFVGLGKMPLFC